MIGYTTVGTSDIARAKQFYCDLFESKGAKLLIDSGRIAMIGTGGGTPMISVCEPYNKEAPTPGSRTVFTGPMSGTLMATNCAFSNSVNLKTCRPHHAGGNP